MPAANRRFIAERSPLADGARIPFEAALLCQARTEAARVPEEACTAFALTRTATADGEPSVGFIFAAQVLTAVIFFAALMAAGYHLRLIQPVVRLFGLLFHRILRLSGAEALLGASNIFFGLEAATTVKPSRLGSRSVLATAAASGGSGGASVGGASVGGTSVGGTAVGSGAATSVGAGGGSVGGGDVGAGVGPHAVKTNSTIRLSVIRNLVMILSS